MQTITEVIRLAERVLARAYEPVADLQITAWRTPEPVPFSERRTGQRLDLKPGDIWGERLFDCAWFRFTARGLGEAHRPLNARIDVNGELCIVDPTGVPVRGLTCVKSTFDPTLGAPGKTIFQIPDKWIADGGVELWADAGFNDLFGTVVGEGRVEFAELTVCREEVRALYYDLQVLADLLAGLNEGDPFFRLAIEAVSTAAQHLETIDDVSAVPVREILRPLFAPVGEPNPLQVSALGHSHLDLAWLWPIRETIRKGARTFATALYNIAREPDFIFGCSQPQLFIWMKDYYPALYVRIKEAVHAGRIELLGSFWVEPDCNIPSGESLVRQTLCGARVFREEFGVVPRFCWEPDVFGYNGQLPQILKRSGSDCFVTQKLSWNIVNRFPHQSFHWVGIDGTSILAHMLPEETYNSPAAPRSLRKISDEYAQKAESSHALMVYGIGDGGGGPDAEHFERLRRTRRLANLPSVTHRTAAEFLEKWAGESENFPTFHGELYLERHQGTFTTQALTKRNNRRCEIALQEAEWIATIADLLCGTPYPAEALDAIWREVLLYQFHDILPGSSIARVYAESNARYVLLLQQLEELTSARYSTLAESIAGKSDYLVFNSLPWPRTEWLECENAWALVSIPDMGYAEVTPTEDSPVVSIAVDAIENQFLRVEFSDDGTIRSMIDKSSGGAREILAPGECGNQLLVFADEGDAWDFATDHKNKDVWVYLRQTPQALRLQSARTYLEGPQAVMEQQYKFGNSVLRQQIILTDLSRHVEFKTTVDWQQPGAMLRMRFPVCVDAPTARFEIPFGSIHRSTSEADSTAKAQIEVPAQQWVDLSDDVSGVALLNDCKYGFRVKGHTLDMNLLRSVPHPGTALIDKADASKSGGEYTDLGSHEFRYALMPHAGRMSEAALTEAARKFNVPPRMVARKQNLSPSLLARGSFFQSDNPAIEIVAIKRAEIGRGWIVRLVNVTPSAQLATVQTSLALTLVEEVNLLEEPSPAQSIEIQPFEIRTLHFVSTSAL